MPQKLMPAFLCLVGLASSAMAQTGQEATAKAMVSAVREGGGSNFDRLSATPTEEMAKLLNEWGPILDSVTGETVGAMIKMQIVFRQNSMYPAGKFDPARARVQTDRLKSLPKEYVETCVAAIKAAAGVSPSKAETVAYLLQNDGLFTDSTFSKQKADGVLQRLKSLSGEAVTKFATISGASADLAPFALVRVDQLFKSNAFQSAVFEAAFPLAEKLFAAK